MAGRFGTCGLAVLSAGLDHFYRCVRLLWNYCKPPERRLAFSVTFLHILWPLTSGVCSPQLGVSVVDHYDWFGVFWRRS